MRGRAFPLLTSGVATAGLAALAWTVVARTPDALADAPLLLWVLVACVVIGELLPVSLVLRGEHGQLLISTAFAFAVLIAYGAGVALPALCLASLIGDLARRRPARRVLFNLGRYGIAVWLAGAVLDVASAVPRPGAPSFAAVDLPLILLAGAVLFAVNVTLVALSVAAAGGYRLRETFRVGELLVQSPTAAFALAFAPLLVIVGEFSVAALPLLALPMLAIHRNSRQAVRNEHQALHDSLTGLPNRALFRDRVRQAIESARRADATTAVMIMDLDHFKEINDTLGHYHGDRLLQLVGARISATLRGEDTVARLGGDEFGVLLPAVGAAADAVEVAAKVRDALGHSFDIDGLTLEVGASIGIACFPAHGEDGETLLQRADIAMYVAKGDHSGVELYHADQDRHSVERLALAGELRRAIEHDELVLHYQPKIDVATGRVVGAEALVRWQHPSLGLLMPADFVPMAEHTGLITPLTRRVLKIALEQIAEWRAQGRRLSVAVNLSARSFLDSQLLDELPELLQAHGVDPGLLELEITESMIVGDPQRARTVLERLNELGVTLAIDDFGTGYSSLAYLRLLPVHEIKIDRSFVFEMAGDASGETIVRSIIDLAHNLRLRAVAEGVEDQALLTRLTGLGCDVAQGYYISRPLPAARLEQWLATYPSPPTERSAPIVATLGAGI